MQVSRSGSADKAVARRRLEMLAAELVDDDAWELADAPTEPLPGRHASRPVAMRSRVAGRVTDSLPPAVRGRWRISAQHVTVVALVVATALALAAWWAVRAEPEPVAALPAIDQPSSSAVTASALPQRTPGETTSVPGGATPAPGLTVHVAGKVRRPGIVSLPTGSRVIDALQAAGGARRGVDLAALNLARPLADGEQILVGAAPPAVAAPPGTAGPPASAPGTSPPVVNLNTATSAELEELPGIGPVTAASILQWRTEHGRFSAVDELLEVSGIGDATLADLRPFVTV